MDRIISKGLKYGLAATTALIAVGSVTSEAVAGAFAIREQSAYSQGASFAGSATCGASIQGMYWNPAAVTCNDSKIVAENSLSFIEVINDIDTTAASDIALAAKPDPGDIGRLGIVPSGSFSYAYNEKLFFGMGTNGPFGLSLETPANHNGDAYFLDGAIFSLNVTPTVGYKVNDYIAVAAGIQIQYFELQNFARRGAAATISAPGNSAVISLDGDDIGFGFTLGATFKPMEGTEIGIGFRSSVSHTLEGESLTVTPIGNTVAPITAKVNTPEIVTLSLRQQLNEKWTVLGTVEWTNWSRLQVIPVTTTGGATLTTFPFSYDDGWFFSLGGEYKYNENWTLRAGAAWELSPIGDESRSLSLPDDDRLWLSMGATYVKDEKWTFNAAYTFITSFDTTIDLTPGTNPWASGAQGVYQGDVDGSAHIFSIGMKRTFDTVPFFN